jgi:hypothetical protein
LKACSGKVKVYCKNCKEKEQLRKDTEMFFSFAVEIPLTISIMNVVNIPFWDNRPFLRTNVYDLSQTDTAYNYEESLPMII